MGRWRPPRPTASAYITPAGYASLQSELQDIWVRRRDVVRALSAAAAEGDRSENAEYIYRKKELAGLDRRIRYLQKRLPLLKVIRELPGNSAVFFGAFVEIVNDRGRTATYRIVGPDEADAGSQMISMDSPLARALLNKRIDDEVDVSTGETETTWTIVSIRYEKQL